MCAMPLILDLTILAELHIRVQYNDEPGTVIVDSLNRQHNTLEAVFKAWMGLESNDDLLLETRSW